MEKDNIKKSEYREVDGLIKDFDIYKDTLNVFLDGEGEVKLSKKYMLKAIDEVWVNAIEDALPSLDVIIRNPGVFLLEEEKVLPIEQTKRVTSRSIEHLSQHTNYINEIRPDGTVMPSMLLNVYQDETMLTYENKFINTLLNYLYAFVARRYESARKCGEDEKKTDFSLTKEFEMDNDEKGKITVSLEVSKQLKEKEVVKNYIYTTDLWKRVERIYSIVSSYMNSDFVRVMGKSYVRPPIMRTNKILKNVDFRNCLTLWEFIESYDNTGYELIIEENVETVEDETVKDFYDTMLLQYSLFRERLNSDFDLDATLNNEVSNTLKPSFVDEIEEKKSSDYDIEENPYEIELTEDEREIADAVSIALQADLFFKLEEEDTEVNSIMDKGKILFKYKHSFLARLIYAQNPTQDFYTNTKNHILSFSGVKSKVSWNYDYFTYKRNKICKINVKGKTLYIYLPLDPKEYKVSKYHQVDVSNSKRFSDLPFLLKVRSNRGEKYALELLDEVIGKLELKTNPSFVMEDYHMKYRDPETLSKEKPPLVKVLNPVKKETKTRKKPKYNFSFKAKLIQSNRDVQDRFGDIRNYLVSFKGVKARMTWDYVTFKANRKEIARLNLRGKTLSLYLALEPNEYLKKYKIKDNSNIKKYMDVPLQFRIKNKKNVLEGKELIDELMNNLGLVKGEEKKKYYHFKYMTNEELLDLDKPLITRIKYNEKKE